MNFLSLDLQLVHFLITLLASQIKFYLNMLLCHGPPYSYSIYFNAQFVICYQMEVRNHYSVSYELVVIKSVRQIFERPSFHFPLGPGKPAGGPWPSHMPSAKPTI